MKKAILCVSFGTSVDAARAGITAVENTLRSLAPDRLFVRAFTSSIIRRILAERGETVPSVPEALEGLWSQGIREVLVQPTHILYGHEYDKIRAEAEPWRKRFDSLVIGRPLLADTEDIQALAAAMSRTYPPCADETLVLFGHGTDHFANAVYPALQTAFWLTGRADVLVGTVEGWPSYEDVSRQIQAGGRKRVHLVPLMLVAGDHAMNDMAGAESGSWASRLTAEGCTVRCTVEGLGAVPAVQALYRAHLESIL
ncbi:sirohydrochlorin cobaltochelatase [uncultured Dysosmobacter sp.]|uniref:sirohydrochlorin cobaltochelatase n=1 Tax=uncultured Dysosmobacter sp. TaxID=2591384 RepID=UPI002635D195|nr:sirohydrochlorin cobaltochelatase [uncultured Dysosmobacter sp.]